MSGDGLPTSSDPYQMLATDENGNSVWEQRTHYIGVGRAVVLLEQTFDFDPSVYIESYVMENLVAGDNTLSQLME